MCTSGRRSYDLILFAGAEVDGEDDKQIKVRRIVRCT
jgi:hypothetical protein